MVNPTTREQGEKKSIIDYVITTEKDLNTIKTMKVDEEKEFKIYKVQSNVEKYIQITML